MGLTQVMLQVKDCEMVCKQTELIPGLKRLSPHSLSRTHSLPPSSLASLLSPSSSSFSSSSPFSLRLPPVLYPACHIVSDSIEAEAVKAIKKVPKHSLKCRLLIKIGLDQNQYSLPQTPNTSAHPPTNTEIIQPQNQHHNKYPGASQLTVMKNLSLFYRGIAFERLERASKQIYKSTVSAIFWRWSALTKTQLTGRFSQWHHFFSRPFVAINYSSSRFHWI